MTSNDHICCKVTCVAIKVFLASAYIYKVVARAGIGLGFSLVLRLSTARPQLLQRKFSRGRQPPAPPWFLRHCISRMVAIFVNLPGYGVLVLSSSKQEMHLPKSLQKFFLHLNVEWYSIIVKGGSYLNNLCCWAKNRFQTGQEGIGIGL